MNKYKIVLKKMLGCPKYEELIQVLKGRIKESWGDIKRKEFIKILQLNQQAILIIAIKRAEGITEEEALKQFLHWEDLKTYEYILAGNIEEFISVFDVYIETIIKFIKGK